MVWAQYNLSDSMPAPIQATTSIMVDPVTLANAGRGQAEIPDDGPHSTVDVSQYPPVFA